jgi:aminoglycoside phosphotransferase (APT) family kinase protein
VPASLEGLEDQAIPTLQAALDPLELGRILRTCFPGQIQGLTETQVQLLRHHTGKRCVVEISLWTAAGPLRLIGKVYAKDRSDVYCLMKQVSAAGFGCGKEFSIPAPVAYVHDLQLLLQEKVEGSQSTESFLSDDDSISRAAADRCALWLAAFHVRGPLLASVFRGSSHMLSIKQWFFRVASLESSLANKARALFTALEYAASRLQTNEIMSAVHGDYTHHQVILDQGSTFVTDWDTYGLADPARDVARFMVGLQRLALRSRGSIRALDRPAQTFLTTYVTAGRCEVLSRLPFQRAAACLEHAKHDVHKRDSGWRERAEATLDEGLRILDTRV